MWPWASTGPRTTVVSLPIVKRGLRFFSVFFSSPAWEAVEATTIRQPSKTREATSRAMVTPNDERSHRAGRRKPANRLVRRLALAQLFQIRVQIANLAVAQIVQQTIRHERDVTFLAGQKFLAGDADRRVGGGLQERQVGGAVDQHPIVDLGGFGGDRRRLVRGEDVLARVDDRGEEIVAREALGDARQVGAETARFAVATGTALFLEDGLAALGVAGVPVDLVEPFLPGREIGARQPAQRPG